MRKGRTLCAWGKIPGPPAITTTAGDIPASVSDPPGCSLRGVDLCQIQHLPLHRPAIIETLGLNDVSVAVRLAVFLSLGRAQKHDAANRPASRPARDSGRPSLQPLSAKTDDASLCKSNTWLAKKS